MKWLWFRDDDLTDSSLNDFFRVASVLGEYGLKPTVSVIPLLTSSRTVGKLVELGFEIAVHGITHISDSSGWREMERNHLTSVDTENLKKYMLWHKSCGINDGAVFVPPGNTISDRWLKVLMSFYSFRISDHVISANQIDKHNRVPVCVEITRWKNEERRYDPSVFEVQLNRSAHALSALGLTMNYLGIGIHHKREAKNLKEFDVFLRRIVSNYEPALTSYGCRLDGV